MKRLAVACLLISTTALAQPAPRGFSAETSFEGCTTSWAFACGKRDASGQRFGTAHPRRHCESFTFRPDGTYRAQSIYKFSVGGTYQIIGATVRLLPTNVDGTRGPAFDLPLAPDGSTLGTLQRK